MSEVESSPLEGFETLGLSKPVLEALSEIGYEIPSPIQREIIPHVLEGRDVVGQAQTGTGKTAAFALPLLTRIKPQKSQPQVLVLVPTRELAIQVAEAFTRYAAKIPGFHVLPIYGGQGYGGQFRQLKRGVQVIVATPGRLCDHLRRGTFQIDNLECLVIDEADEMLRMGFIDEVEWILEQSGTGRQIALFSATMPEPIRRIAKRHLDNPVEITIKTTTTTAATIRQRYWMVSGVHKLDALTRILEGETFDGILVFVRTKTATVELATKLEARGFASSPLNGDIPQNQREQTVEKLKAGEIDILVATDVAARGLDVKRISHVINYDIPYDVESYVHRIGRTGRAGRTGEAILFVAPRERRLLNTIERTTRQKIELMQLPTRESINNIRIAKFKQRITDTLAVEDLGIFHQLVEEYRQEHNIPALEIAAALAFMNQGDIPFLLEKSRMEDQKPFQESFSERSRDDDGTTTRYRIDVGFRNGAKPGHIVGAIANEGGIDGKAIKRIRIFDLYSTLELPSDLGEEVFKALARTRVCGRPIKLSVWEGGEEEEWDSFPRKRPREKAPFKRFAAKKFRKP